jgi:UDP-N-acetyl-D-glucosamine dehydrogenase
MASPVEGEWTELATTLRSKIADKTAVVGIIGLGYVGLPLAHSFVVAGYSVIGFDCDMKKINAIAEKKTYIMSLDKRSQEIYESPKFTATSDMSELDKADAVLICVPTPVGPHMEPELDYVLDSARACAKTLVPGQLIVLESTTYPGTTDEEMKDILDTKGLACGAEYFLAYSPEREDPGNLLFETSRIPKLVGGVDPVSYELSLMLYTAAFESVHGVSSARVAESAKLVENIYRAVNIALVNELKMVFDKMDVDIWEVLDAASTKPFGFKRFNPGPGVGGHCIPVDPFYLTWKARAVGVRSHFIERAGELNKVISHYVVDNVQNALNEEEKTLKKAKILMLGVAYKEDVDDCRETPAWPIWRLLEGKGAEVIYHDPCVSEITPMRHFSELSGRKSVPFTPETLAEVDVVLLITAHTTWDLTMLEENFKGVVVDTRGTVKPSKSGSYRLCRS